MSDRVKARERRVGVQPDGVRQKAAMPPQPDAVALLTAVLSELMVQSSELRAIHSRVISSPSMPILTFWARLRWLLTGYAA